MEEPVNLTGPPFPPVQLFNIMLLNQLPELGRRRILELLDRAPFLLAEPVGKNFWLYLEKNLKLPAGEKWRRDACRRINGALDRAGQGEFSLLHLFQEQYPPALRQIYDPPLLLYVRGDSSLLGQDAVAVVGARHATDYGVSVALDLAARLAGAGLVVVSGLAKGIDAAAHLGALQANGKTAAVLGSGIDVAYPRQAAALYRRLSQEGCLVSEFPPGFFPAPQNFPIRNRIISGLCLGTVIVEATERSGSLITARLTLEQGRELFGVPGPVHSPYSVGPNYLIKQGAKLVQTWQDVVEELPAAVRTRLKWQPVLSVEETRAARPLAEDLTKLRLTKDEETVYKNILFDRKVHLDTLLGQAGLPMGKLSAILLALQFKGLIAELPGQYFLKSTR